MKAGVSTACLYPMPTEEALYDLALGGVQHVEIFINTHSELRRSFIMSLAEIMRRFDVTCRSLHPFTCEMEPMLLFSAYERRMQDVLDYYRHYFAAMQALGAEIFVLHGNKVPAHADNISLYLERFSRLAALGKEFGVTVAQENVARCTSRSLEFLKTMKQQLGRDAHFVLDLKQAVRSQENPMAILKALGESVVHVHISDHGAFGDCLPVGSGSFPVKRFLQTLSELSPHCSVILELYRSGFKNTADLVQNYQVLNRMIQSLDGDRSN
ncbi:MAG: sugar phosphate isomerase/epimerase [Ruminococcus sp.]|nr:sugar phosphate isomerase/epimerase [Ruminococcus sp.]